MKVSALRVAAKHYISTYKMFNCLVNIIRNFFNCVNLETDYFSDSSDNSEFELTDRFFNIHLYSPEESSTGEIPNWSVGSVYIEGEYEKHINRSGAPSPWL